MDAEPLHAHVRAHTGLSEAVLAEAVPAVLGALGFTVGAVHRGAIAQHLPPALAASFVAPSYSPEAGRTALIEATAARARVSEARALELVTATLDGLATLLPEEVRALLARELPEDVRPWLAPREERGPGPRPAPPPPPVAHHVSDARPGSAHPLSEAHPERAQAGSVAASGAPHADTKLSSTPGPTQAREHETLAEGHPGPRRP